MLIIYCKDGKYVGLVTYRLKKSWINLSNVFLYKYCIFQQLYFSVPFMRDILSFATVSN